MVEVGCCCRYSQILSNLQVLQVVSQGHFCLTQLQLSVADAGMQSGTELRLAWQVRLCQYLHTPHQLLGFLQADLGITISQVYDVIESQ